MYGTYSDPEWEPEEWYYKGFPRKEDKQFKWEPKHPYDYSYDKYNDYDDDYGS